VDCLPMEFPTLSALTLQVPKTLAEDSWMDRRLGKSAYLDSRVYMDVYWRRRDITWQTENVRHAFTQITLFILQTYLCSEMTMMNCWRNGYLSPS
jgi:hypothetical protein